MGETVLNPYQTPKAVFQTDSRLIPGNDIRVLAPVKFFHLAFSVFVSKLALDIRDCFWPDSASGLFYRRFLRRIGI